jgi:hypothetical protein
MSALSGLLGYVSALRRPLGHTGGHPTYWRTNSSYLIGTQGCTGFKKKSSESVPSYYLIISELHVLL